MFKNGILQLTALFLGIHSSGIWADVYHPRSEDRIQVVVHRERPQQRDNTEILFYYRSEQGAEPVLLGSGVYRLSDLEAKRDEYFEQISSYIVPRGGILNIVQMAAFNASKKRTERKLAILDQHLNWESNFVTREESLWVHKVLLQEILSEIDRDLEN